MNVTLFKAFPDLYRQSMRVYADCLYDALGKLLPLGDRIVSFLPKYVRLNPPLRYLAQYIGYQFEAPFAQGDVNHIVDHVYGHLLHTLDAQPTVVTFHDAIGLKSNQVSRNGKEQPQRLRLIQHYNLSGVRKAGVVICVSEKSRRNFLNYVEYPDFRTVVISNGVKESFFNQQDKNAGTKFGLSLGFYILHVGHTRFYKNIPALFHVLAILKHMRRESVKLLKVGEMFTSEQETLIDTLGIRNQIIYLGLVPEKKLPTVYSSADVLLFPSWDEGFGFPILEAMASGIPVIASNRGSLPEVVGDAGILVDPDDYETMAKSIVLIMDNINLRMKLRDAGLKRARQYTWQKTAEKMLHVYRCVYNRELKYLHKM